MLQKLLAVTIRTKFALTQRKQADALIRSECHESITAVRALSIGNMTQPTRVPKLMGVDEDMRDWSPCMTLEHNTKVNHTITEIVVSLAKEQAYISTLDPKIDFNPSPTAETSQIAAFETSVKSHFEAVEALKNLRSKTTSRHPLFGAFNAHAWHCMFGFHLQIHRRQLQAATKILNTK